jgi:hypothetical protein
MYSTHLAPTPQHAGNGHPTPPRLFDADQRATFRRLPPILAASIGRPSSDYMVRLRGGIIVTCCAVRVRHGGWINLPEAVLFDAAGRRATDDMYLASGYDVRVSDVIGAAEYMR